MFKYLNLNPYNNNVDDCVIRAVALIEGSSWNEVFYKLADIAFEQKAMLGTNRVWDAYLRQNGYKRYIIPNSCPECYTVRDFCTDNNEGSYLLATGTHVVTVIDGTYYDTIDCGDEVPIWYYERSARGI